MSLTLTYGALNLTATPYLIEFGLDTGAPENVTEALAFLLQDGEVELSSRASNRALQFNVLIEGANLLALATAEAALIAETEKVLNTLTVDPGDSGPATVYEIFRAQVSLVRDDDWEQARIRRYTVTVKALPFPRSASETVTAALAASGTTTTLVDDGSATTNWTATVNGGAATPAVVSGAVKTTSSALLGTVTIAMTRTASITTSSTKYLMVDWKPESPIGSTAPRAYGDGTELTRVGQAALPSGYTRTWFYVAAASIAVLRLDSVTTDQRSPLLLSTVATVRSLAIDNINRTDVKPAIGTNRQLQRTIDVAGSVRSQGSVAIEHASSTLGDVIAYFWPDEAAGSSYSPPLRQYRVSGGTVTSDSAMVSGAREELIVAGTATFDVPSLAPGAYLLMCRCTSSYSGTATASLTWVVSSRVGGAQVGSTYTKTSPALTNTVSYTIRTLDRMSLPVVDVDPGATTGVTRITLTATKSAGTGSVTVNLDEVWLFNTTIGQFTQVAAGTLRMFMAAPTVASPRPALRIGTAADGSDSYYPAGAFWQMPEFKPPRVNVFTVTTDALDAGVSLRAAARWHTDAAS